MRVLGGGLGLFVLVWLAHFVWWRIHIPRAGRRFLYLLFLGTLPAALGAACLLRLRHPLAAHLAPASVPEGVLLATFYLSLALAYLALYVALEGDSPSLSLIRLVAAAGPDGITEDELRRVADLSRHVISRVALLVTDGMATRDGERYRITGKGRRLLAYYRCYWRLTGVAGKTV